MELCRKSDAVLLTKRENRQQIKKESRTRVGGAARIIDCLVVLRQTRFRLLVYLELGDALLDVANNLIGSCKTSVDVCFCCLCTHLLRS